MASRPLPLSLPGCILGIWADLFPCNFLLPSSHLMQMKRNLKWTKDVPLYDFFLHILILLSEWERYHLDTPLRLKFDPWRFNMGPSSKIAGTSLYISILVPRRLYRSQCHGVSQEKRQERQFPGHCNCAFRGTAAAGHLITQCTPLLSGGKSLSRVQSSGPKPTPATSQWLMFHLKTTAFVVQFFQR